LKAKTLYRIDTSAGVLARPQSQILPLVVDSTLVTLTVNRR
jgi:hypothetical protein